MITVRRVVPDDFVPLVQRGEYTVHGGVVRNARRQIVGHLQIAGPEALERSGLPLESLMRGTIALGGINVAVSAAGFAVVCRKLNAISRRLETMHQRIEDILEEQLRLRWQLEVARRATLEAQLENLWLGIQTQRDGLIDNALSSLAESISIYREITLGLLEDARRVYTEESESVRACIEMGAGAALARAHALSHIGHPDHAAVSLQQVVEWQRECAERVQAPLKLTPKPVWLGRLHQKGDRTWQNLVAEQKHIQEALRYGYQQFRLCAEHDLTPDTLVELVEDHGVVLLMPHGAPGK